ncbi:MAG: SRPBCC domain-containing protein [Stigonema ocellatum SAG 48.90 = DSM 106950]|nr:SRPBCC domain-containing protein [Stigonema ocellatum SAG 48.90 = DSM 106950]
MLKTLTMDVFYPYPQERVWQVLTNRRALAAWLMENDFEPRVGHKFQFQHSTLPGIGESIDCEVIELDEPKRLSYTWQDGMMCQPSIVTWTLKAVDGGTRLQLEHKGLSHVKTFQRKSLHQPMRLSQPLQGQFSYESTAVTQTLALPTRTSVFRYEALDSVILSSFLNGGWDYSLNQQLLQVLVGVAADERRQ